MTTELDIVAKQMKTAASYLNVFGVCDGDTPMQAAHVKCIYRKLSRVLHPDRYTDPTEKHQAGIAFAQLGIWHDQARKALEQGTYGQPLVLMNVRTRKGVHDIVRQRWRGDLATMYVTRSTLANGNTYQSISKVAHNATDSDLLQAEASALKALRADSTDQKSHPFFPQLLDSFSYAEKGKPRRQVNVLENLDSFYDTNEIAKAYPAGLDIRDVIWIWRRLLFTLMHAHEAGIIHGAVLPPHILVSPKLHGIVLIDWCYSVRANDTETYPPIKAIVNRYKDWYPAEVHAQAPPTPATDIAMAARSMIGLLAGNAKTGNLPPTVRRELRAFFKGCLSERQSARPSDAWELLLEFDELLEHMGRPYYPRKFHTFAMPSGTA